MAKSVRDIAEELAVRYVGIFVDRFREIEACGWKKPWVTASHPAQNIRGTTYTRSNQLLLSLLTELRGWKHPLFMTSGQAHLLGIRIVKGEKSFPVTIFRNWYRDISGRGRPDIAPNVYEGLDKSEKEGYGYRQLLTYKGVFNIDQTDIAVSRPELSAMIDERYAAHSATYEKGVSVECIDGMLEAQGWVCPIRMNQSEGAYYSPSKDYISIPARERFSDIGEFYGTLFHEMSHSTGAEGRLDRDIRNAFGDSGYAREELVAELSAAVLNGIAGIDSTIRESNLQYLKGWQEQISDEPMTIMSVLSDASKSAAMICEHTGLAQERAIAFDGIQTELDRKHVERKEDVKMVHRV